MTRFYLEQDWPEELRSGAQPNMAANFQALMFEALRSVMEPFMADVQGKTEYESIKGGYYLADVVTPTGATVELLNSQDHWIFREEDMPAHWPPWGPGTPLDQWAMKAGIPTFLVARKIAMYGTKGNHIVGNTWPQYRDRQADAVQRALYAFVLSLGTRTSLGF